VLTGFEFARHGSSPAFIAFLLYSNGKERAPGSMTRFDVSKYSARGSSQGGFVGGVIAALLAFESQDVRVPQGFMAFHSDEPAAPAARRTQALRRLECGDDHQDQAPKRLSVPSVLGELELYFILTRFASFT